MVKDKDYLRQYSNMLRRIGTARLMHLPEGVKQALKDTTDLKTKVEMLTLIEEELNGRV